MSVQHATRHAQRNHRHQRGATLIITLVLMLLVGLAAMSSISGSERNLQIAGNMQVRNEALAASQALIEQTISSTAFSRDPAAAAASVQGIDIDGDGRADGLADDAAEELDIDGDGVANGDVADANGDGVNDTV